MGGVIWTPPPDVEKKVEPGMVNKNGRVNKKLFPLNCKDPFIPINQIILYFQWGNFHLKVGGGGGGAKSSGIAGMTLCWGLQ